MVALWKLNLFKRDNYCCLKCGKTVNLSLHHIFPKSLYPELKTNMDNQVTLCEDCHKDFHNNYLKRNIEKCNPITLLEWLGEDFIENGYKTEPDYLVKIDKRYEENFNRIFKEE